MTAHEVETPPGHMLWRVCAVLCCVLVSVAIATAPARAVEEVAPAEGVEAGAAEEEPLTFEELQAQSSQRAQEFFPDPYEEPSFFPWISIPVLIIGVLIALLMLGAYLWWQPRFAAERRERQRS